MQTIRNDGLASAVRGPDNKLRDLLNGTGRPGFSSVTRPFAQQMQRKIDLLDWRGRRQPYSKLPAAQTKGHSTTNDTGNRHEHNGSIPLQSLTTSKVTESSVALGSFGTHPSTAQYSKEKLSAEIPLNTFLLSTIDHDLPGTLPSADPDKQLPQLSSCPHIDYINSLTRTQDTTKYDFCNPELYDDPFGDPIPSGDAHQISRVTPAKYIDNIPRIQRSLSIKQDSAGGLPGVYDPMGRSMDFNTLASKTRHRLGIGTTPLGIPSSMSLANLLTTKGETISRHAPSKASTKEQKGSSNTPHSTAFRSSLAHSRISMDSDSRDSDVYPVYETSNLTCLKRIDSDISSIQEKGSPLPASRTATAPILTDALLSPGTLHVLHSASAKTSSKATIERNNTPPKTRAVVSSSGEESPANDPNDKKAPVTLESLWPAVSAPNPTRHTFKPLNPARASQYSYMHGRSTTFKNTYTAVLSVGPLEDSRMVMFRTKKSQQSPMTRAGDIKDDILLPYTHIDHDSDLETHPLEPHNCPRHAPKTTHESVADRNALPTIAKEDDAVSLGRGAHPPEKLRSANSQVPSDILPTIAPLDKGAPKRSASGASLLHVNIPSSVDKSSTAKNPQIAKGDLPGTQKKTAVRTAASLTNVLKHRDPSQQLLSVVHAADVIRPSPTLQPND